MNIVLLESLAVSDAKIAGLAAPLIAAGHRFTAYTDGNYDPAVLIERAKDADIQMCIRDRPETARLSCGGFPCFTLSPCRVPTVSYTHLDVYKRQRPHREVVEERVLRAPAVKAGQRQGQRLAGGRCV